MLSMANVRSPSAAASYFASDNYYARADADRSGQWIGEGAERLGLKGRVDALCRDGPVLHQQAAVWQPAHGVGRQVRLRRLEGVLVVVVGVQASDDAIVNAVQDSRATPRGEGEVFVAAPVGNAPPQPGQTQAAEKPSAVSGNRVDADQPHRVDILVAEDNEVNALIATAFLEKFGHSVRHEENGKLAVAAINEEAIDVVFMDIHMPEMDGIEATRQIRNVHDASALPIIGLTAEAFLERHALFMDAGMNGVLTKPFTEQQLQGILVQHMPEAAFAAIPNESLPESHENESNEVPLGDEEKLESFSKVLKPEMLDNLLGKAEESLTTRMEDLRRGVENGDTALIHEAAHAIKGSSGSMFGTRISNIAAEIDTNHGDMEIVTQLMPRAEVAASETIDWWRSKRPQ
mgnify:CR=1 FL=1